MGRAKADVYRHVQRIGAVAGGYKMNNDELTRLRLENINLRRIVGEQGAHIERLNVMLLAAQQSASKAIEDEAAEAIQKASAK